MSTQFAVPDGLQSTDSFMKISSERGMKFYGGKAEVANDVAKGCSSGSQHVSLEYKGNNFFKWHCFYDQISERYLCPIYGVDETICWNQ